MIYNRLSKKEKAIIENKETEPPFSGKYYKFDQEGTYLCKKCNQPLFYSEHKFDSNCGWPSFDQYITKSIKQIPDKDGRRTEIICSKCKAHLGHIFKGENYTKRNTRLCINSLALNFKNKKEENKK